MKKFETEEVLDDEVWSWRSFKLMIFEIEEHWSWWRLKLSKFEVGKIENLRNLKLKFVVEEVLSRRSLKLKLGLCFPYWAL